MPLEDSLFPPRNQLKDCKNKRLQRQRLQLIPGQLCQRTLPKTLRWGEPICNRKLHLLRYLGLLVQLAIARIDLNGARS